MGINRVDVLSRVLAAPHPRRAVLKVLAGGIAGGLFVRAAPAAAIIGGTPDGGGHPYAGAVDATPLGGQNPVASGVLIAPTVFLTVAHFTRVLDDAGLTQARVTFDPVVSVASTWYTGAVHTNPAFNSQRDDPGDLAVIVFDAPVPGITPASLPAEGLLDQLGPQGLRRAGFDVVGYGVSRYRGGAKRGGKRRPDYGSTGTRKLAEATLASLSAAELRLRTDNGAELCKGDSGAPSLFAGSDVVAGILEGSWSMSGDQCESGPWNQRVDTPASRAFLGQFVTLP
jgi:hypothetical protein